MPLPAASHSGPVPAPEEAWHRLAAPRPLFPAPGAQRDGGGLGLGHFREGEEGEEEGEEEAFTHASPLLLRGGGRGSLGCGAAMDPSSAALASVGSAGADAPAHHRHRYLYLHYWRVF